MKKITLKVLKKTRRYPIVDIQFDTEVDRNDVVIDRYIRRRLADAKHEKNPVFGIVNKTKAKTETKPLPKED